MKLSDAIKMWKDQGMSEEKALSMAKAKVSAAGAEWSPVKTKLFYEAWNTAPSKKTDVIKNLAKKLKPSSKKDKPASNSSRKEKPTTTKSAKPSVPRDKSKYTILGENARSAFTSLLVLGLTIIAWTKEINLSSIRSKVIKDKDMVIKFLTQVGVDTTDLLVILDLIERKIKYNDKRKGNVSNFANALKASFDNFLERIYNIPPAQTTYLKNIYTFLRSSAPSDNSYKTIVNKAAEIGVPEASSLFTTEVEKKVNVDSSKLASLVKEYRQLNSKLGGNEGFIIPTAKRKELSINPSKDYIKHNEIQKELNVYYLSLVRSIVDKSGKSLIDVNELNKKLKEAGLNYTKIPVNYEGKVDAKGRLYTREGFLLADQPSGVVKMNTRIGVGYGKYDPETGYGVYCEFRGPNGRRRRVYTENHALGLREDKKKKIVDDFIENIPKYRAHWLSDIKAGNPNSPTKKFISAVITELMYQLTPRPGSKEKGTNTKFEDSKGFIYLKKKDLSIDNNIITFSYSDKNGAQNLLLTLKPGYDQTAVEAKLLFNIVQKLYERVANPEDYIWVDKDNEKLTYELVKKYVNTVMPTFNPHKFRNAKATRMAKEMLDNCELKVGEADSAQVSAYFMDVMTQVGKELGHHSKDKPSPNMAMKAYVLKSVSNEFFDRYDVSPTSGIAKNIRLKTVSNSIVFKIRSKK
jgi:hypothetical protein